MTIRKCDVCGVEISERSVEAGLDYFYKVELCRDCGLPILEFLDEHSLLQKQLEKIGFKKPIKQVS